MAEQEEINNLTRSVLAEFGVSTISKLANELRRLDKVASQKLVDSLDFRVKDFITSIILDFEYEDYGQWVELGRKPGKFAPVKAIEEWCRIRNIDEKYAYPINYKIYKLGIKPTPFVSNIIDNGNSLEELISGIESSYEKKIEIQLEKLIKDSFNVTNHNTAA
jgi:hypothetical protein